MPVYNCIPRVPVILQVGGMGNRKQSKVLTRFEFEDFWLFLPPAPDDTKDEGGI